MSHLTEGSNLKLKAGGVGKNHLGVGVGWNLSMDGSAVLGVSHHVCLSVYLPSCSPEGLMLSKHLATELHLRQHQPDLGSKNFTVTTHQALTEHSLSALQTDTLAANASDSYI